MTGADQSDRAPQLRPRAGVAAPLHHLEESRGAQPRIWRECVYQGHPAFRGGAQRQLLPRVVALTTAAERLQSHSLNVE